MVSKYLLPEDDGLAMRDSQDYAKDKLTIFGGYISRFITSMRLKPWRAINFIDLQAGPGKNIFDPSKEVMLGSPLIALTAKYQFTNYRFVELKPENFNALQRRVNEHDRAKLVKLINDDCNIAIDDIVAEIQNIDKPFVKGKWPSLNLAFLDPEGLELNWETVEKLGQVGRMDLIINFSTSGFTRNADQMLSKEYTTLLDKFFGTPEWKTVYCKVADRDSTHIRRAMIDFYRDRLSSLGYINNFERDIVPPDEKVFRNSRGAQIYTLMFVSKHELGVEFWNGAIQEVSQPKLF